MQVRSSSAIDSHAGQIFFSDRQPCRSDLLQRSTAVQVRSSSSSAIDSHAGQIFSDRQPCRSDLLQRSIAVQVRSSAIDSHAGQIFFSDRQPCRSDLLLLLQRSTAVQVQIFSPVGATKQVVRSRSSAEPHSLVTRSAPCGHVS